MLTSLRLVYLALNVVFLQNLFKISQVLGMKLWNILHFIFTIQRRVFFLTELMERQELNFSDIHLIE